MYVGSSKGLEKLLIPVSGSAANVLAGKGMACAVGGLRVASIDQCTSSV